MKKLIIKSSLKKVLMKALTGGTGGGGHKYVKREGSPGHYRYYYRLPNGSVGTKKDLDAAKKNKKSNENVALKEALAKYEQEKQEGRDKVLAAIGKMRQLYKENKKDTEEFKTASKEYSDGMYQSQYGKKQSLEERKKRWEEAKEKGIKDTIKRYASNNMDAKTAKKLLTGLYQLTTDEADKMLNSSKKEKDLDAAKKNKKSNENVALKKAISTIRKNRNFTKAKNALRKALGRV